MNCLTVSTLNEQIKNLLETTFVQVFVEGELSRITYHNSGHIYFTLKDKSSTVSCVMFRGNASKLKFRLEDGLAVTLTGAITLYKPRGSYQINVSSVEPAGHGALALAYEQLKSKLSKEGLFDPSIKKELPRYPTSVAILTSSTGAALSDMKRVASQRWPLAKLVVYDTLVQGDGAALMLKEALEEADSDGHDVIVISRGGGSVEDLYAFNDEALARAIFASNTATVSAVGHEIDWVITDFVSDVRAATPSVAMQLVLPDQNEVLMSIANMSEQAFTTISDRLVSKSELIRQLLARLDQNSFTQKLAQKELQIRELRRHVESAVVSCLQKKQHALKIMEVSLDAHNPSNRVEKGFAQILKDGNIVEIKRLKKDDKITLVQPECLAVVRVEQIIEQGGVL